MVTVYPIGTTIYDPEKCNNGYTLFGINRRLVELIDMNGNSLHKWNIIGSQFYHYQLLENGHLFLQETEWDESEKTGPGISTIREYDWDSQLVWEYALPKGLYSCTIAVRLTNGNILAGAKEVMPEEYKLKINDPVRRELDTILSDVLMEITPDGETVWDWHACEHIDVNRHLECDTIDLPGGWNWTHFNCLQPLPENKWYDCGDKRFRPGNILVSPRTLGFIFIVDKETKKIVWRYKGDYGGGLAGQHSPKMVPRGIPGEGNIVVVDNGSPPIREIHHSARSFILEINPVTKNLEWLYREEAYLKFFVPFAGDVERLLNGNTLITENFGNRIFEVTRDGETVWEYTVKHEGLNIHGHRYPYDHCEQLKKMGKPEEKKVVPPPHVSTKPMTTDGETFDLSSQQRR